MHSWKEILIKQWVEKIQPKPVQSPAFKSECIQLHCVLLQLAVSISFCVLSPVKHHFQLFLLMPVCALPCFRPADWHTCAHCLTEKRGALYFISKRASFFFCGASFEWHNGWQVSILSLQNCSKSRTHLYVDDLILEGGPGLLSKTVTTGAKERQINPTGIRLLYHSYQYKQSLTAEVAH